MAGRMQAGETGNFIAMPQPLRDQPGLIAKGLMRQNGDLQHIGQGCRAGGMIGMAVRQQDQRGPASTAAPGGYAAVVRTSDATMRGPVAQADSRISAALP